MTLGWTEIIVAFFTLLADRGDRSVSRGGMRGQVELLRAA